MQLLLLLLYSDTYPNQHFPVFLALQNTQAAVPGAGAGAGGGGSKHCQLECIFKSFEY